VSYCSGDLLQGSFPEANMNKSSWMVMATIALLPCALLTDIRAVSHLSFWCVHTHTHNIMCSAGTPYRM
jgi:vesicular inhibitory amino acid transporter